MGMNKKRIFDMFYIGWTFFRISGTKIEFAIWTSSWKDDRPLPTPVVP